ncbi:IQ motif and S7 domain-containing protein 1 [Schistosoma haematobium]|uniref:IQ motif and S7 domain-containing protein 1 n=1 Tax=Schistosoma haematobium TaxID=6185 RepID=A0A922IPW3_SCHHA|nr:IQ motif and S7 domain-containing protein 1 [Schistosoma haematobium]KAH9584580.1 IQ motif and S7 domain-containing protein 1 [Schistosoma haematobium]CAH8502831.1 unnamed protein product [Schistosoma haematobium]
MTSGTAQCDCIFDFYSNNIASQINQCNPDYSCNINHHRDDNTCNWNIDYPKKFSSWHYSRNYHETSFPSSKDSGIKSNTMRPTSMSTEHLNEDLVVPNGLYQKPIVSTNSCSDADCLCSLEIDRRQDHEITECNKCIKYQAYHHENLRTSSGHTQSNISSDSHPLVISNPSAVAETYDLSDHSRDSSYPDDHFDRMVPSRIELPNICYELGEDGHTKAIEEIESYYGGRLRTQRAARIIQNAYRDYRLRAEYARLKLEKGIGRIRERNSSKIVQNKANSDHIPSKGDYAISEPTDDVDDLVIEGAYVDWSPEAGVSLTELPNSINNETHLIDCIYPKTHPHISQSCAIPHTDSLPTISDSPSVPSCLSPANAKSSINNQNLRMCNPQLMHFSVPNSSLNYNNDLIQIPSEYFCSPSTKQLTVFNSPQPQWVSSLPNHFDLCSKTQVITTCEHCSRTRQPNLTQHFGVECIPKFGDISPGVAGSSVHSVHYKECCLPSSIPNRSSFRNNCCPYCVTIPNLKVTSTANKPPALVCMPASRAIIPPQLCNNSGCPGIPFPMGKVYKTPTVISSCVPLNNELLQLHTTQLINNVPHVPLHHLGSLNINKNDSSQRQHPTHVSCGGNCYHIPNSCQLHMHPSYLPHNLPSQTLHPSIVTPFSHRNPCINRLPNSHEKRRKRTYRIGLNIFNKSPVKGIDFLIKNGFLENSPQLIARFLLTRKGLSRVAIGEYLGNTKNEIAKLTTRQFIRELKFRNKEVDEALRILLGCFRTPGESQKIVHLLNEFQSAYVEQNTSLVKSQFRNSDTVMILAYAIVMLHTDMYSPNVRPQSKMTKEEFVRNLRGVDSGEDLDRDFLLGIYDRIKSQEMSVQSDHTDQVRKIQKHLTGPQKPLNLSVPQRRLVCYCRLYEVPDKNKRERSGAHQRELFLFNDLLLITKSVQKRRRDASVAYQVRMTIQLFGVKLIPFETVHHPNGLELLAPLEQIQNVDCHREVGMNHIVETPNGRARIFITLNTKTSSDRARLLEDLQECILEVTEMERLKREEISKQKYNQVHHHCLSHKSGIDKSGNHPKSLDNPGVSFNINNSHTYSDHDNTLSSHICAPIACLMNATETRVTEQTNHMPEFCQHYKLPDGQRLSGDSGLMADLDAVSS